MDLELTESYCNYKISLYNLYITFYFAPALDEKQWLEHSINVNVVAALHVIFAAFDDT